MSLCPPAGTGLLSEDLVLGLPHESVEVLLATLVGKACIILLAIAFSRQRQRLVSLGS